MGGDGMKGPQIPPLWEHRKCKNNHQAVGFSHLESPQDTETIHNTRQNQPSAPGPTEIQALIKNPWKSIYHRAICLPLLSVKYHLYGNFPPPQTEPQAAVTRTEPLGSVPAGPSASGDTGVGDVLGSGDTGAAQRQQQHLVTAFNTPQLPENNTTLTVWEKSLTLYPARGEMGTNSPLRVSSLQRFAGTLLGMRPRCLCDTWNPSLADSDRIVSRALSPPAEPLGAQTRPTGRFAECRGHQGLLGLCSECQRHKDRALQHLSKAVKRKLHFCYMGTRFLLKLQWW